MAKTKKPQQADKPQRRANPDDIVKAEVVELCRLQPNKGQIPDVPKNPRFIKDDKFRQLCKSLEDDPEMTGIREIVVYPHNGVYVIVGGTMRYHALKELGFVDAIVKVLRPDTTPDKIRRFILKDNSAFGEYDWEAIANEWDASEVVNCGIDVPELDKIKTDEEAEEDNYNPDDALSGTPRAKLGDIYALGKHRLICGDSTDPKLVDLLCGDTQIDLVLTDPPSNVDYSSKNETLNRADKGNRIQKAIENDKMASAQFQDFLIAAFGNCDRHLKQGGAFYIWHAGTEGLNFKTAVKQVGWELKQVLVWNKNNMVLGRQDYQWKHEPCLYGWKPGASHYFVDSRSQLTVWVNEHYPKTADGKPDFTGATKSELQDILNRVWELPTDIIDEDKPLRSADHPTMKPLKLMGRLIKNSTRQGETVLDLFGGSGSTLMACQQLGRVCFMMELDPAYIDVIVRRWEEYTQQEAQYLGNFIEETPKETPRV